MQLKTPPLAPKIDNQELVRWLQFLRDDITNINKQIEDLKQEIKSLQKK